MLCDETQKKIEITDDEIANCNHCEVILRELTDNMSNANNFELALEGALKNISKIIDLSGIHIYMLDKDGNILEKKYSYFSSPDHMKGVGKIDFHKLDSLTRDFKEYGYVELSMLFDSKDEIEKMFSMVENENSMIVPLKNKNITVGIICFSFTESRIWKPSELSLLKIIASTITFLMVNRHLEEERKAIQEAMDSALLEVGHANMAKIEFISNMSEEIRTPLNTIISSIELTEKTILSETQHEYILEAKKASESLLYIVNDILDFSKIESGKMEISNTTFNLRAVVEEAVLISVPKAQLKGIDVNIMIYSDVPVYVNSDPAKLKQIINNIVNNAVKFTDKGEIVVSVRRKMESKYDSSGMIKFTVVDSGVGIDKETQSQLFGTFIKANQDFTGKNAGTGLGLALSKKIIDAMGGEITVISELGRGSEFVFELPLAQREVGEYRHMKAFKSNMSDKTIMVIDDSSTSRNIMKKYLEYVGCSVVDINSPSNALDYFLSSESEKKDISCIVVEYSLPGIDGIELAKKLKSLEWAKKIPLVLITSLGKEGDSVIAKEAGFSGYLTKPIRYNELVECINIVTEDDSALERMLVTKYTAKERKYETKKKILIVDEDEESRKRLSSLLMSLGLSSDVATSFEDGYDAVKNRQYDLVFLGCDNPQSDGSKWSKKIKDIEEVEGYSYKSLIISMTSSDKTIAKKDCIALGMDDCTTKPIELGYLKNILDKYVGSVSSTAKIGTEGHIEGEFETVIDDISASVNFLASDSKSNMGDVIRKVYDFIDALHDELSELRVLLQKEMFSDAMVHVQTIKIRSSGFKFDLLSGILQDIEKAILIKDYDSAFSGLSLAVKYADEIVQRVR